MKAGRIFLGALFVGLCGAMFLLLRNPAPGKLMMLRTIEVAGSDGAGHRFIAPAKFRFDSGQGPTYRLLRQVSVSYIPTWRFTVLTNDSRGHFVPAFEPEVGNFSIQSGGSRAEFFVPGDERLLNTKWQVRVTRSGQHKVAGPLSSVFPSVTTKNEIWVSEPIAPVLADIKWELPFEPARHPESPKLSAQSEGEQFFLTNDKALFGPYQFQLNAK